jgi:hypothetical protein
MGRTCYGRASSDGEDDVQKPCQIATHDRQSPKPRSFADAQAQRRDIMFTDVDRIPPWRVAPKCPRQVRGDNPK